jgi:hypothetical protein
VRERHPGRVIRGLGHQSAGWVARENWLCRIVGRHPLAATSVLPSRSPSNRPSGERAAARAATVKPALTLGYGRWRLGRRSARLLRPGRRRAGWLAQPRAYRDPPADLGHPGPERPRRRHTSPTVAARTSRYGAAWLPRRASGSPANTRSGVSRCCPCFGSPEGVSLFAPADGRGPGRRRAGSGGQAPDRRRVRPVSGRLEDLQDVRKLLTDSILGRQPACVVDRAAGLAGRLVTVRDVESRRYGLRHRWHPGCGGIRFCLICRCPSIGSVGPEDAVVVRVIPCHQLRWGERCVGGLPGRRARPLGVKPLRYSMRWVHRKPPRSALLC